MWRWIRAPIWSGRMDALTRDGLVNAVIPCEHHSPPPTHPQSCHHPAWVTSIGVCSDRGMVGVTGRFETGQRWALRASQCLKGFLPVIVTVSWLGKG